MRHDSHSARKHGSHADVLCGAVLCMPAAWALPTEGACVECCLLRRDYYDAFTSAQAWPGRSRPRVLAGAAAGGWAPGWLGDRAGVHTHLVVSLLTSPEIFTMVGHVSYNGWTAGVPCTEAGLMYKSTLLHCLLIISAVDGRVIKCALHGGWATCMKARQGRCRHAGAHARCISAGCGDECYNAREWKAGRLPSPCLAICPHKLSRQSLA
eukprot:1161979-Pelagomonas_calceolata.AAC.1